MPADVNLGAVSISHTEEKRRRFPGELFQVLETSQRSIDRGPPAHITSDPQYWKGGRERESSAAAAVDGATKAMVKLEELL